MPFKPTDQKSDNPSKYLGILPVSFLTVEEDKSKPYEVFLKVTVLPKDSKWDNNFAIMGNFERDTNGNITVCPLLKKINRLFEAFGDDGGVNIKGEFVYGNDEPIQDIAEYFTVKYSGGTGSFPYLAYFYKKQVGDKQYTHVYPYMVPNNDESRKSLAGFISFVKSKGILKEAGDTTPDMVVEGTTGTPYNGQF